MFYRISLFLAIPILVFSLFFYKNLGTKETPTSTKDPENEFTQPFGLPPVPWPKDNPYSKQKAELGRLLYFDKRLSSDETVSCATCHNIPCAYSDCKPVSIGINNHKGIRNSPTVINAAYSHLLFWDGRASSLEEQAKGPLSNPKEMTTSDNAHDAYKQCVQKVQSIAGYKKLFNEVFGSEEITIDGIAKAIATFERTILSGDSPYDHYRFGQKDALTPDQIKGLEIYKKSNCMNCHGGFNLSDKRFMNIGIGMDQPNPDLGRYVITHNEKDWGAFKVPTLRDVEHSYPYMHDGSLATLEEVIEYYNKGGIPNKNLNPLVKPLNLTPEEKSQLLEFLRSLSGKGWQSFKEPEEFPK